MIKPLDGQAPIASTSADIFAFGILAAGVYIGESPFEGEESDTRVALRILDGERPEFPKDPEAVRFTPQIQALIQDSWCTDPTERPTVGDVVARLEALLGDNGYVQGTPNNKARAEFITDADFLSSDPQQTVQINGTDTDDPSATPTDVATPRANANASSDSNPPMSSVPTQLSSQPDTTTGTKPPQGPTNSNGLGTRSTPGPGSQPQPPTDGTNSVNHLPGPRQSTRPGKPLFSSLNIASSST